MITKPYGIKLKYFQIQDIVLKTDNTLGVT